VDQRPAFEALLQQSIRDRDEIQAELLGIYKTIEDLKNEEPKKEEPRKE
jgi:hypothetical protein